MLVSTEELTQQSESQVALSHPIMIYQGLSVRGYPKLKNATWRALTNLEDNGNVLYVY
jgi:hypothetical protein